VLSQGHQRDPRGQVEEDEERGEEDVHAGGQGPGGGAETFESRLLEAQEDQLGEDNNNNDSVLVLYLQGHVTIASLHQFAWLRRFLNMIHNDTNMPSETNSFYEKMQCLKKLFVFF